MQNVFGVWPVGRHDHPALRERLHAYAEKAIREAAAAHHPGTSPNAEFEAAVHAWLDAVLDGPVGAEMTSLVARLDLHARSDALGQKLIALTAPGVPDVYQGTELWEDSLVDPDNRRPVDYATRAEALGGVAPSEDSGRGGGACGCGGTARRASPTVATRRYWPTARPPTIWWRFCAATTC